MVIDFVPLKLVGFTTFRDILMKSILGYEKAISGKFYMFTRNFDVYACHPFVGILKPR